MDSEVVKPSGVAKKFGKGGSLLKTEKMRKSFFISCLAFAAATLVCVTFVSEA